MKEVVKKIKEFGKVIKALTELVLEIGTLIAVIKMVLDSL
ncbi:hypothetical protein QUI_2386 [Clostridioides difficile P59]|nr:hypothetical protein QUI_2386 [Clostridioides difficile P59]